MAAADLSRAGRILREPRVNVVNDSEVGRFIAWLEKRGRHVAGYAQLWKWSVEDLEGFWGAIWDFFEVRSHAPYERVLASDEMPGARWFPGARINYAEHLFGTPADRDTTAVIAHSQARTPVTLTFGQLTEQVARARVGLQRLGVGPGDRVVAYLPNIPETLVAFAATASLGAVWASCAPELGQRSVIDRLGQLDPVVLLTVGGYGFRDRVIDRRAEVASIRRSLPTLRHVVDVPYAGLEVPDALAWNELLSATAPLVFEPVAFEHPLYVLFSSGTTGRPKAIVHGHGGMLLEHLKSHALSWDLKPGGRLLWFTTTSWMMWNALVSALLVRCAIVMFDGDPTWPDLGAQWKLAEETRPTFMGASPAYLMACSKAGLTPGRDRDLGSIEVFGTAGAPLPAEGYRYIFEQLGRDVLLVNGSGGTEMCSAIVGGGPLLPVYEGEISGRCLGVAATAFDTDGREVIGALGELVITKPMPSMPVSLWGGDDGHAYREAYFDYFPGVWRQGDWIRFTDRGSCVVAGRSDATLNRGGVCLGTGEFYGVVENLPEVADSLVVHVEDNDGGPGSLMLFVVMAPGILLDEPIRDAICQALRFELSPRHVPDLITEVPAIPRTLSGKKLETPVKRILLGARPEDVASVDALLDPHSLDVFARCAAPSRGT